MLYRSKQRMKVSLVPLFPQGRQGGTVRKNNEDLASGKTNKRYKGLDKPPKYASRTCTLNYGRDFSWTKEQQVSVITLTGHIKVAYKGYNKHLKIIRSGVAKVGGAKIWYSKSTKTYYLALLLLK